jgi:co-chaperonin GroES (HSP10)
LVLDLGRWCGLYTKGRKEGVTMGKRIVPLGSNLLVKKVTEEEVEKKTKGGIILPNWRGESVQDFLVAEVLAIGDVYSDEMMRHLVCMGDAPDALMPWPKACFRVPQVGDWVLVNKYGLHKFKLDGDDVYLPGLINIAGIVEEVPEPVAETQPA